MDRRKKLLYSKRKNPFRQYAFCLCQIAFKQKKDKVYEYLCLFPSFMYTHKKLVAGALFALIAISPVFQAIAATTESEGNPFDIFNNDYDSSSDSSLSNQTAPTTKTGTTTKPTTKKTTSDAVKFLANPFGLMPLYEGQPQKDARRINLIFVGYNYPGIKSFLATTKRLVGYDTTATGAMEECIGDCRLRLGNMKFLNYELFAIEPFKSHKTAFNLWYYPNVMIAKNDAPVLQAAGGLQNTYIIRMFENNVPDTTTLPVVGLPTSFSGNVDASQILFDATNVLMPQFTASEDARLYNSQNRTHDKGIALAATMAKDLFGLVDESEGTRSARHGYPNCLDRESASGVLSQFAGKLDGAYTQWKKDFDAIYPVTLPLTQTGMTVASYSGACGTALGAEDVFRTTEASIMSGPRTYSGALDGIKFDYRVPVFGAVNRSWIEKILAGFDSSTVTAVVGSGIPTLTLRNMDVFTKTTMAKVLAALPVVKRRPYAETTLSTLTQILKSDTITKKQRASLVRLRSYIKNYLKGYK